MVKLGWYPSAILCITRVLGPKSSVLSRKPWRKRCSSLVSTGGQSSYRSPSSNMHGMKLTPAMLYTPVSALLTREVWWWCHIYVGAGVLGLYFRTLESLPQSEAMEKQVLRDGVDGVDRNPTSNMDGMKLNPDILYSPQVWGADTEVQWWRHILVCLGCVSRP